MAPSDSLTVLTTLFGVAITITVFVVAIVSWLICHDRQSASVSGPPANDLIAEPGRNATGLTIIVVLLLAGAVAAGQIVHWAWA